MPAVTKDLLEKRRIRASELKMKGMSINSISKIINSENAVESWGTVGRRTILRDIARYFEENKLTGMESNEEAARLRDAYIGQYESLIEKMSIELSTKKDWKPFEKFSAMDTLRRALGDFAEIMNWNEGRKNPNLMFQQNNVLASYENAAYLVNRPKELKGISQFCKIVLEKKPMDEIEVEVLGTKHIKEDIDDDNT